jgi:hypothetical protein
MNRNRQSWTGACARSSSMQFVLFVFAALVISLTGVRPAYAAAEGELCGRGGGFSRACDPGLRCDVRFRLGPLRLGLCEASETVCGGLLGASCPGGQYCDYPLEASCGAADQTGTCRPTPEVCTEEYRPVCGCDDRTYGNLCQANAAGVSVASHGACDECRDDDECPNGYCDRRFTCQALNCPPPPPARCTVCGDGSQLLCRRAALPCPEGQVREIVDSCYGACVDRQTCELASCDYDGKTYAVGESFPSSDGCNSCSCTEDGTVVCTLRLCVCSENDDRRRYVSRDPEECTRIDFICEPGTEQFADECGCGCEL